MFDTKRHATQKHLSCYKPTDVNDPYIVISLHGVLVGLKASKCCLVMTKLVWIFATVLLMNRVKKSRNLTLAWSLL